MTDQPVEIDPWIAAAKGAQLMQDAQIRAELDALAAQLAASLQPVHQLAQAIVDATSLDDIKPVAEAILSDGDTPI